MIAQRTSATTVATRNPRNHLSVLAAKQTARGGFSRSISASFLAVPDGRRMGSLRTASQLLCPPIQIDRRAGPKRRLAPVLNQKRAPS